MRKVSIITINYNNLDGLKHTIESVLHQTARNQIQYIIVDGASTDGTQPYLHNLDNMIDYIISEPDNGIYNAMNKGIPYCTGEYVLYLNSGDFLYSDNTIEQVLPMLDSGVDFIIGKEETYPGHKKAYFDIKYPLTFNDFYIGGPIPHNATFIKRSVLDIIQYDESLRIVSDWKFFIEGIILKQMSYKIINNIVTYFEEGGISSNKRACDIERNKVFNELIPLPILADYKKILRGSLSEDDAYSNFFFELKKYNPRFAKITLKLVRLMTKILSYKFKSLRFVKDQA